MAGTQTEDIVGPGRQHTLVLETAPHIFRYRVSVTRRPSKLHEYPDFPPPVIGLFFLVDRLAHLEIEAVVAIERFGIVTGTSFGKRAAVVPESEAVISGQAMIRSKGGFPRRFKNPEVSSLSVEEALKA